jgi:glycosyltransferase involved in cell wall biosynthesis
MLENITMVIPVYRNAATLRELHERVAGSVETVTNNYEILFVNDSCPAGSLPVLRDLAGRDDHVAVLALEENVGQNRAVMAGLAHARGQVVVVMDADLQDAPEAIPRLLAALQGEVGAVFAGRRGRYESGVRLATSHLLKWLLHVLSGRRIPPDAGLFVALRREVVERLLEFRDPNPYVVGLIGRTGSPLVSIPVERLPSPDSATNYTGWMRLRLAGRALLAVTPGPIHRLPLLGNRADEIPVQVCEYISSRFSNESLLSGRGLSPGEAAPSDPSDDNGG